MAMLENGRRGAFLSNAQYEEVEQEALSICSIRTGSSRYETDMSRSTAKLTSTKK